MSPTKDIFAAEHWHMYRTTNVGGTWNAVNDFGGYDMALNSTGVIYVADNSGVYLSIDEGNTWSTPVDYGYGQLEHIALNSKDEIFVGGPYSGVLKSSDNGSSWVQSNVGIPEKDIRGLAVTPSDEVYASTFSQGLFHSSNGGSSWSKAMTFPDSSCGEISLSPWGAIFVSSHKGVFKSTDNGGVWSSTNLPVGVSCFDFSWTGMAIAGTFSAPFGGVYISTDKGGIWTKVNSPVLSQNPLVQDIMIWH